MSSRSIIQFYDEAGASELGSLFDIFSGVSIPRGSTSPPQRFRVYNNFSGVADIVDTKEFELLISADDQFLTIEDERESHTDFTRELIEGGYVEIRCTYASESGGVPSSGATFVTFDFGTAFAGIDFDVILASGSNNYNEYEVRFNIPASGTDGMWNTSGSASPSVFADWTMDEIV